MSQGLPVRRSGACLMKSASHSGGSPGIVIVPGAMAFTRTSGASAFARTFVSITTPAFETECAMKAGQPSSPPESAKLMIVPRVRRSKGAAACAQKNGAFRFESSEASQISSVVEIWDASRSEEHTSELQSPDHLVCRLLLEKKKKIEQQKT